MVAIGFNAAISVRVSNELSVTRPRTAKFSVVVVVVSSFLIGLLLAIILIIFRHQYPRLFADSAQVQYAVNKLTHLLAACTVINNIQPALSGVAIWAGWQAMVAYVNIACYYVFGIPLGLSLGFAVNMGIQGIWMGMLTGRVVHTGILFWLFTQRIGTKRYYCTMSYELHYWFMWFSVICGGHPYFEKLTKHVTMDAFFKELDSFDCRLLTNRVLNKLTSWVCIVALLR